MTQGNFARVMPHVLEYEGGFTKDKRDPGNWTGGKVGVGELRGTKKGIAAASFPNLDIEHLTDAQINEIYRVKYWNRVRGDDLPPGVDLSVMDGGVNSGPSRSVKWLQAVVGETQDGIAGPVTLNAAGKADAPRTIKAHCAKRLGFVRSLAIWNTFGKGWSRRIANVEATALSWVLTKPELEREAKDAKDKATQQGGGAVVVGGGGGVASPELANSVPWWVLALVITVIVGILVVRTIINAQRAQALAAKAKEA
jgi:lysozyme family protein